MIEMNTLRVLQEASAGISATRGWHAPAAASLRLERQLLLEVGKEFVEAIQGRGESLLGRGHALGRALHTRLELDGCLELDKILHSRQQFCQSTPVLIFQVGVGLIAHPSHLRHANKIGACILIIIKLRHAPRP